MAHASAHPAVPRRSCLVVPGSAPTKLAKAAGLGADEVVIDLEDAVVPAAKAAALWLEELLDQLVEDSYGYSSVHGVFLYNLRQWP